MGFATQHPNPYNGTHKAKGDWWMTRNSTASRRPRIVATERQFTARQSTHTLELNEWRAVETRRVE
ncbi:hypothetical protein N7536_011079 [Penicillium majusculum]|nr:hypothetical protein N7536_011079 [Penicillium majusculum]